MDRLRIRKNTDNEGKVFEIGVSGYLVVDTSQNLKNEIVDVLGRSGGQLRINFEAIEEIDVSGIQLIVAFVRSLEKRRINYSLNWNITDDLKDLLESVGLADELYVNAV